MNGEHPKPEASRTSEELVSDSELVRRFLAALRPTNPRVRHTRAGAVARYFSVGLTAAEQVCRRHGFNPDESVRYL